jgi:hypothetical protein
MLVAFIPSAGSRWVFCSHQDKTFLDNSCGNGQFLIEILERKIANGISHKDALKSIYGVELDQNNTEECRLRLLCGSTSRELRTIVEHNIICADALDPNDSGWSEVGFYWIGRPKEQSFFDFSNGKKISSGPIALMSVKHFKN